MDKEFVRVRGDVNSLGKILDLENLGSKKWAAFHY